MTHLFRAGALLAAILVFVFIGLKVIPVPTLLTEYGFHPREAEAKPKSGQAFQSSMRSHQHAVIVTRINIAYGSKGTTGLLAVRTVMVRLENIWIRRQALWWIPRGSSVGHAMLSLFPAPAAFPR